VALSLSSCKKACQPKSMEDYETNGCGNFMVYDAQPVPSGGNGFIIVQAKRDSLNLTSEFQSFSLSNNSLVWAQIEELNMPYVPYCTDVLIQNMAVINTWTAISGTVELRIAAGKTNCDERYVVDVYLHNAVFKDANGNQISIGKKVFLNVIVNYLIG
jgi:hypothetical protein